MSVSVEFFFDCSSPWTYLAFHNMQTLARELAADVVYRPILVGGIFNSINPSVYQFRQHPVPAKDHYVAKDLQDWARKAGLVIRWQPSIFPINSVKAMRGCLVAQRHGRLVPYATAIFEAYWRDDRDIREDAVLADVCDAVGLDREVHFAGIADPATKQALRDNTDDLIRRGGFGTPTVFVGGGDMYFGNDRLGLVRDAVLRARGSLPG
jgi:2-hydroxychromene-2-carboxylate isomerase